jgi:hypothetical protein
MFILSDMALTLSLVIFLPLAALLALGILLMPTYFLRVLFFWKERQEEPKEALPEPPANPLEMQRKKIGATN